MLTPPLTACVILTMFLNYSGFSFLIWKAKIIILVIYTNEFKQTKYLRLSAQLILVILSSPDSSWVSYFKAPDVHMPAHSGLADKDVPNPHNTEAMRFLKSLGSVKEQLVWRHGYWYLTNKGTQHLRDDLHRIPEMVPGTGRPRPQELEGEPPARLTPGSWQTPTEERGVPCCHQESKARAGEQPNPSLEVGLVMDMINSFSKVGGILLCWINLWSSIKEKKIRLRI